MSPAPPLRKPITRRLDNPGVPMYIRSRLRMDPCRKCGEPLNTRLPMQVDCDKCRKKGGRI